MTAQENEIFKAALTGLLASDAGGLSEFLVQGSGTGTDDKRAEYARKLVEAAKLLAKVAVTPPPTEAERASKFKSRAGS